MSEVLIMTILAFCVGFVLVLAAIMTSLEDDADPEEDEEQMQYIMRWKDARRK